jgi:gamma-glutamyl-gamma-aminobutyrate hydrolase PuuD
MILRFFFCSILISVSSVAQSSCTLPEGKKIRIGCTDGCSCTNPSCVGPTLQEAAKALGLPDGSVEFPAMNHNDVDGSLQNVDAVLSGGGHDFDPKYVAHSSKTDRDRLAGQFAQYGNLKKVTQPDGTTALAPQPEDDKQKARDEFEAKVLDRYLAPGSPYADKPYLGICYGMQMLAARAGIPPVQDLPEQRAIVDTRGSNNITLSQNSALAPFLTTDASNSFSAIENHHQALDTDYSNPNVKITGTSHDKKIPEVIEVGKNALGVQFHAEATQDNNVHLAPFKWLLTKACQNINKQAATPSRQKNPLESRPTIK